MKITSTSCSSTQEVSQDLNKASVVAADGTQPTLCLLCLSEQLVGVQKLKLLLRPLLDPLLFANATLQHSEPSMNYISAMKLWEATVTDL